MRVKQKEELREKQKKFINSGGNIKFSCQRKQMVTKKWGKNKKSVYYGCQGHQSDSVNHSSGDWKCHVRNHNFQRIIFITGFSDNL